LLIGERFSYSAFFSRRLFHIASASSSEYPFLSNWQFILSMIDKSRWIYAKTMPQNPHYYMLRNECADDDEFVRFATLIRQYGYRYKFGKAYYTQLNVNNFYYWTMGYPLINDRVRGTILINRKECRLGLDSPYDQIAEDYDTAFSDECSADENVQTATLISRHNLNGKTLEIGCGSGSVTKELSFNRDKYIGIDPSWAMLEKFRAEPHLSGLETVHADFEGFAAADKFNFVFATYGAASYVRPEFWSRLDNLLEHGGTFFLMFYADDYTPITHIFSQSEIPYYSASDFTFNCPITIKTSRSGNYTVIEGVKM
jgi:hypothetical protein